MLVVVGAALLGAATAAAGDGALVRVPATALTSSVGAPTAAELASVDAALAAALPAVGPLQFAAEPPSRVEAPATAALRARAEAALVDARADEAVRLHRELIDVLARDLATLGDVEPLLQARLALAGLYLAGNEPALARSELDAAARLRPAQELDPRLFSPVVVEAFEQARDRVAREPPATVDVAATPAGAEIVVDGVPRGPSPQTLTVARGPHLLQVQAPGHAPSARVVDLQAGSRTRVDEVLQPRPAFSAWQTAQATLRARGTRTGDLQALAALRAALASSSSTPGAVVAATWVPVVARGPDGPVVVLARVGADVERVGIASLGAVRAGDAALLQALVAALDATTSSTAVAVQAAGLPDARGAVRADFAARALGVADGLSFAGAADEPGWASSPWVWLTAGVGAATVTGIAVGVVVLMRPAPVEEREPDRTQVVFTVVP